MAGQRQLADLLVLKRKRHLTKIEIKEQKNNEISAPNNDIKPQNYLNKLEKREFNRMLYSKLFKIFERIKRRRIRKY